MITKLGTDFFKGQRQEIYLVVSTVTTAGELKSTQSGKTFGVCSCKALEREDGVAVWVSVKSFREAVRDRIARAEKGTPFLAWGRLDTREYNGKEYTDLLAEGFLSPFAGDAGALPAPKAASSAPFYPVAEVEERELPF